MTAKNRMRKTIYGLAVVTATALASGAALAANDQRPDGALVYAPPSPAFSWTGFYAGPNIGGGFSTAGSFDSRFGTTGDRASGVAGGGQAGYNYQLSPLFVIGVENDFQATNLSTGAHGANRPDVKVPWFGTGRARAGVALLDSRLLLYGTGGLAFGKVEDTGLEKMRIGWTAGTGVEWAFLPRWSAKLEYRYVDLYRSINNDSWAGRRAEFQTIGVGVNYRFNLF